MTDIPFLAAVLLTLLAWEALQSASPGPRRAAWAVAAIAGMVAAALLRPMFWVFLLAWLVVCLIGLLRGNRAFYAGCLLSLLIIGGGTALLRPSGYEYEARDVVLPQLQARGWSGLYDCLHDQLPYAMFGEQLRPISILGSVLVLLSSLLLIRKHLLWTLAVLGTFCVTILLSDEPRYWLMILPILMLSWLVMTCWIARRFGPVVAQGILLASIAIVGLNNLAACIAFFYEQHRGDFMLHYKKGEYQTAITMAEKIHEIVLPSQKVLGPSGSILSIFSGVHVYTKREVMPRDEGVDPKAPAAFAREHFDYVIFPASLYREKEPLVSRLIDKHIILQRQAIATVTPANVRGGDHTPLILATARFSVPASDWRKLPKGWRPPTTKPVKHTHAATRPIRKKKTPTTRTATTRAATRPRSTTRPATRAATTASGR